MTRSTPKTLFLVSRPISWINTAFPFGAAYLMSTRELDLTAVVGILFFLVPYNLALYGINDVFDYASDLANPRKGGIEGALLPPRLHRAVLWLSVLLMLPFLGYLVVVGTTTSTLWLLVSMVALAAYSVPPLRFKERPVLDSITSSAHFVTPALVGLTMGGAEMTPALILLLVAFFLWGMASHAFGAVQDIVPDRAAGISSIATVFGARTTVRSAVAMWALAGVLMLPTGWPAALAGLLAVPYIVNAAGWWNVTDDTAAGSNRAWRRFIALNYASGFAVTILLILAWQI